MAAEGDAITMLTNIGNAMNSIIDFIAFPAYVAGACCLASGLMMMTSQREGAVGKGIMLVFIAGIFGALPGFISDLGTSLSFTDTSILSIASNSTMIKDKPVQSAAVFSIFTILRVVGMIAIYKGCNRLKFYNMSPNGDPRLVSEAMTLIFMGGLVTFSKEFIKMIGATVGGPFETHVNEFLGIDEVMLDVVPDVFTAGLSWFIG